MPIIDLTKRAIDRLPAPDPFGRQKLHWDRGQRGFVVLWCCRTNGGRRGGGPAIESHSANGVFRAFRAVWNFAAERDPSLPANPVRRLRRAWFPERRRTWIVRSDQLPAFYKAVCELPSITAR